MITISQSEIATWTRCPRQWLLTYYLGTVPADPPVTGNMQLGSRIATAMEGYYGYDLDPSAVISMLYRIELDRHPEHLHDLTQERDLAAAMVGGYTEWLAETGKDAHLHVVAVETDVQVPLPGGEGLDVQLRARMDRVVLDEVTGLLSFMDDKTAATFEKHDMLALDPQFRFYSVVQREAVAGVENAPVVAGGTINTLRRVKRSAASRPPYYLRDSFRYTDTELDAELVRIRQICWEIVNARAALDDVYRQTGGDLEAVNRVQRSVCRKVPRVHECKWDCPFVTLCPMMDDGSDWPGVITGSGRYVQEDPYAYYRRDALRTIRTALSGV